MSRRVTTVGHEGGRRIRQMTGNVGVGALIMGVLATLGCALAVAACGSTQEQNPSEPHGFYPVKVSSSFPTQQKLAQRTNFVVTVTNSGHRTIPDVAVSILNPQVGAAAQSFGYLLAQPQAGQPLLASRSRPTWIVMRNPGPCKYSCKHLGPGGAATAYTDTWALGRLAPGHSAKFAWRVEAVKAGKWDVEYQVAAGLNGYAKAVLAGAAGHQPVKRTYKVMVATAPRISHVKADGQVVYKS